MRFGPNGNTGTQVNHEYSSNSGEKATVIVHATKVNGEESSGEYVEVSDKKGNTYYQEWKNEKGETTHTFEHTPGGGH